MARTATRSRRGGGPKVIASRQTVPENGVSIGTGRPISRSTLVRSAQVREHLNQYDYDSLPNLVELQLVSYQWFLNVGLRELFSSFSPIEDFTGTMSLEFLDYTLGEPKFSPDECRERDLTYEMPMKVKVRLVNKETGELKESEVYLGELPCMTERGTFIVNGAERVVVAQLSRSPGAYFKEEISYSGRRMLMMQIIPQEGAWLEAEVSEETSKEIAVSLGVKIGQSKRMPITTLLRAFSAMDVGQPHNTRSETLPLNSRKMIGRVLADQLIDFGTGEVVGETGQVIDEELFKRIGQLRDNPALEVASQRTQCATTRQILDLLGHKRSSKKSAPKRWWMPAGRTTTPSTICSLPTILLIPKPIAWSSRPTRTLTTRPWKRFSASRRRSLRFIAVPRSSPARSCSTACARRKGARKTRPRWK